MIKIIKPGRVRAVTCPYCDCVFSFSKEDVRYGDQRDYYEEIDCPCCRENIELLNLNKEDEDESNSNDN